MSLFSFPSPRGRGLFLFRSPRGGGLGWGLLLAVVVTSVSAHAQQIDLSLNVLYNNPGNPTSAGTWQLVGKSSHSGIVSLNAQLTGIVVPPVNVAPLGLVNGDPCAGSMVSGCAGFYLFVADSQPGYVDLFVGQAPIGFLGPGDEEGLFYGVGTLADGSPSYAGKPMGNPSIGPTFTSLTPNGIEWATGDVFSNPAWSTAAILASGTFNAGMTPGFYSEGENSGAVFTSVPLTSTVIGNIDSSISITDIVRTNLVVALNDGDYNNDGVVNAADYVFWRDTLGKTVTAFAQADGNGSTIIDAPDYTHWKQRFGNLSPGSGSGSDSPSSVLGGGARGGGSAIPEPATWLLALLAACGLAVKSQMCNVKRQK